MRKLRVSLTAWATFLMGFLVGLLMIYHGNLVLTESTSHPHEVDGGSLEAALSSYQSGVSYRRQLHQQLQNQSLPYVRDVVCGGCRRAHASLGDSCGSFLDDKSSVERLSASARAVARNQTFSCGHCIGCRASSHQYWRFDRVLPSVAQSSSASPPIARTRPYWYSSYSVPASHRLPESALRASLTDYLRQNRSQHREFYFDYNPSIVSLPAQHPLRVAHGASYLASFRVSNLHSCFRPSDRLLLGRVGKARDWLGLALLDRRLNVMEAAVFDAKAVFPAGQDFRLFVLHEELYLSSYDIIAPLRILPTEGKRKLVKNPPERYRALPRVFDPDQPGHTTATLLHVYVRSYASCAPCGRARGYCGKNFNYIESPSAGQAYVEIWPSPPHTVRVVDLEGPCQRDAALDSKMSFVDYSPPANPSYATVEELYFPNVQASRPLLTRGRGGACCAKIQHEEKTYWVGIEHVKTPSQGRKGLHIPNVTANHYLSRFYAFEMEPPFRIAARSGLFCLGFGPPHPLVDATRWRILSLGESFERCPRIHFVSGLAVKEEGYPNNLLIVYGINDCVSALAQIHLRHVRQLLFGTPPLMFQGMGY